MARRTLLIAYIATYLIAMGTALRFLARPKDGSFWSAAILISAYLLFLIAEPFTFRRNRPLTIFYLIIQIVIVSVLALITPEVDFWAALFLPVILQLMHNFRQRIGFIITGFLTLLMGILMLLGLGPEVGIPLILINGVIYFFLAAFIATVRDAEVARQEAVAAQNDAEKARAESEKQRAELQTAYQQLQSYTAQAEELAVLQERNRLARNLHDSVTQTIFSMRLTAEAARMLMESDPDRVTDELDKLQVLAKSALSEMRSLIFELRPTAISELGLVPALRQHVMTLERQYGLSVELQVSGESHLTDLAARRLFRICQEALNNIVKHAHTSKASVNLRFDNDQVFLQIKDPGVGFDPRSIIVPKDHMGLAGMQERAEAMGGQLTIDSNQGQGTTVTLELPTFKKEEHDD